MLGCSAVLLLWILKEEDLCCCVCGVVLCISCFGGAHRAAGATVYFFSLFFQILYYYTLSAQLFLFFFIPSLAQRRQEPATAAFGWDQGSNCLHSVCNLVDFILRVTVFTLVVGKYLTFRWKMSVLSGSPCAASASWSHLACVLSEKSLHLSLFSVWSRGAACAVLRGSIRIALGEIPGWSCQ